MSKVDDIEAVLDDGRYNVETKVDCIHSIIDEGDDLTFGEWCRIGDLFQERLYGGIKQPMSIREAVYKCE